MGFQDNKQERKFMMMFECSLSIFFRAIKLPHRQDLQEVGLPLVSLFEGNRPAPEKEFMVILVSLKLLLIVR